jgi:hypothetical protein
VEKNIRGFIFQEQGKETILATLKILLLLLTNVSKFGSAEDRMEGNCIQCNIQRIVERKNVVHLRAQVLKLRSLAF